MPTLKNIGYGIVSSSIVILVIFTYMVDKFVKINGVAPVESIIVFVAVALIMLTGHYVSKQKISVPAKEMPNLEKMKKRKQRRR